MSAFIFRFALGAVGGTLLVGSGVLESAAYAQAQNNAAFNDPAYDTGNYSSERASPPGAESYDSYVADPAESYVVEGDGSPAEMEPPRESMREPAREPMRAAPRAPMAALEPRWQQPDPEPYCRAYFPAGPGRDRSGTLCEQSDGALRLTAPPRTGAAPRNVYAAAPSQYCREYQQTVFSGGYERTGYGKACWQRDGSWQIVSAPTLAAAPARPRDYAYAPDYAPPPTPAPAYTQRGYMQRPAERRLKMPEFYFGNLFGWLRPRDER